MAEYTLKEFETINLYSNKNIEGIIREAVSSSSNAVLVSVFEDAAILLDHDDGQFYMVDYKFDPDKLTLKFESYEPVELKKETDDFRSKVYEYFDDEEVSTKDLTDSYKDDVIDQEKYINELIKESVSTKDFTDLVDYSKVVAVREKSEIEEERFFKFYKNRLETHPLTEIKYFNWKDPVIMSLVETEKVKLVNESAVEKANDLWKQDAFKEKFEESSKSLIEDVEEGADSFKELLEQFPQIFYLDKADRKTLFGKAVMNSNDLREEMDDLLKGIDLLFEKFDLADMKKEYLDLVEQEEDMEEPEAEEDMEEPEKKSKKKKDEEPEEEPAKEITPEEIQKIANALKKITEKVEDEKLKEDLDKLVSRLEGGKDSGTSPEDVKEAVSILSL
tara:strand:- start:50 stop:1219 length:1170 start_codon:yes stop_codon:yes gene_type:complete